MWSRPGRGLATTAAVVLGVFTAAALVPVAAPGVAGPAGAASTGGAPGAPAGIGLGAATGGAAALVDTEAGTGVGSTSPGNVSEYPGASVPLGMVQFSPDTSPHRGLATGSGYDHADSRITGFSLTHLSGPGCAIYGDVPVLPFTGAVPTAPADDSATFSHRHEQGSAGTYAVRLGSGTGISVRLTATTRSALGSFTYPPATTGGLLFKVGDSANGSSASTVRIVNSHVVEGSVTSGDFCGIPGNYTLYFVARFSATATLGGTWEGSTTGADPSCGGPACGAWVRFGSAGGGRGQTVLVKIGVSFVSDAGAAANLATEDPGFDFAAVARRASAEWNAVLGRMAVTGGTVTARRTFYTALYHSLLFPSVFSDDDGRYVGFDHRIHRLGRGQVQYSNISEDDIYRTEVPLLAVLLPGPTSQMVRSLLRDGTQTPGGFLPKWVIADNDAGQWDGDSVDPIIADAYAFGARDFDVHEALDAMVHGATTAEGGLVQERENLAQYEAAGWVPAMTYDITSYPYTDGGSETLEYATDDFAISRLAQAVGDSAVARRFAGRAQNWQYLFDGATGYLAARQSDGSFPPGPAFQPASPTDRAEGVAEPGFEEGNAVQYTWDVPQDLGGLIDLMGGPSAAVSRLDLFFTELNATRYAPYEWAGNEPGEAVPFVYDYAGAPWKTQAVVRRIMTTLYRLQPVDEPGEDDLGALSSWYVWAAVGLYPETPGTADLVLSAPLFPAVTVTTGAGRRLTVTARHAPDTYIEHVRVGLGGGRTTAWDKASVPAVALTRGATVAVDLGRSPNRRWAATPAAAPPSYATAGAPAVAFTMPGGAVTVGPGGSAPLVLGVQEEARSAAPSTATVSWHVAASSPVAVSPASGTLTVDGGRAETGLVVSTTSAGSHAVTIDLSQGGVALPSLTVDVSS